MTHTKDEALRLALEALDEAIKLWREEMEYRSCIDAADSWEKTSTAIKQALAAPVQEPAFHGFMDTENCCVHICYTPWAPRMTDGKFATAYYTTPPSAQRQWVDMPELELLGVYEEEQRGRFGDHARGLLNVQAKLKEKNS